MTNAERLVEELRQDEPQEWAINIVNNMEDLPFDEKFELTLELMWNFGLHFDMRTAEYILIIPACEGAYKVNRSLAEHAIQMSHKVNEEVDDAFERLQELFGTRFNS